MTLWNKNSQLNLYVSIDINLRTSLALFMNVSPDIVIRSADASDDFVEGLFLARQFNTVATSCSKLDATGSKGSLSRVVMLPPRLWLRTRLLLSGINICNHIQKQQKRLTQILGLF